MKYLVYLLFFAVLVSCQETPEGETKTVANQSEFSINKNHAQVLAVNRKGLKKIDDWQEYRSVNDFLKQYQSISPNEALNNSRELNKLVEHLKDSLQPTFLASPSFSARVNLMYNETLRLFDMSTISSIKHDEVNLQVEKLLDAFSAVNSKINTIVQQQELDEQIDDPKFNRLFPGDSVPKEEDKKPEVNQPKKTLREQKMQQSKEQRMKLRQEKIKYIQQQQKKPNEKKKKKDN